MKHNAYDKQQEGNIKSYNIQLLPLDEYTYRPMAPGTYKYDGTYGIEYKKTSDA